MTDRKPSQHAYRIGLIVPSSNTTMETEIPQLLSRQQQEPALSFTFHSARVRLRQVTPHALQALNEAAGEAVDTLCDAQVDSIMYACLVAAMFGGRRNVVATTERLANQARCNGTNPAVVTSAGSLVTALAALNAQKVSLIAPYKPELTETVSNTLREYGITVVQTRSLSVVDNQAVGRLDPNNLISMASEMDLSGSDALILSACVQMPSLAVLEQAEARFGLPVLSAATASVYALLTALGIRPAISGAGKLLENLTYYGDEHPTH
ncbi:maleate isomerase [Larkinella ripae]